MSEFPEWIEDYFGVWFEPTLAQANEIHRAYRQAKRGEPITESREWSRGDWDYLVRRILVDARGEQ